MSSPMSNIMAKPAMSKQYTKYVFAILGSVALIFFACMYLASTRGLTETLEAESAEIAREFTEGASLLINHLNGKEDLDKPPLFYWTIALISKGFPNWELAARLPSLISACLIIFLFFRLPWPKESWLAASLSGFIFFSSIKVFWMSQIARIDMSFSAACFLAICTLYEFTVDSQDGEEKATHKTSTPWLFFISASVAVMLKGPVGAILIFVPPIIYLALEKRWGLIKKIFLGRGMPLFLILTLPWFVAVSIETDLRFFHRFILEENLSRFTNLIPGGTFKDFNQSPIYSYPVYFLAGFFPWSLLAPFWTYEIIKNWRDKDGLSRLFFIYLIFVFIFFSVALSKRSDYILPAYPVASFLTVRYLLNSRGVKFLNFIILLTCSILATAAISLLFSAMTVRFMPSDTWNTFLSGITVSHKMMFILNSLPKYLPWFLALCIVCLSCLFFHIKANKSRDTARIISSYALHMASIFLLSSLVFIPAVYKQKDARPFCHNIAQVVGSSPLFYFGFWDEECTFYLHRKVSRLHFTGLKEKISKEKQFFLILREKDFKKLKKKGINFSFEYRKGSPVLRPLVLVSNRA